MKATSMLMAAIATTMAVSVLQAATLERDITFGAERFSVSRKGTFTEVAYRGAVSEFRAGRPDLPWVGESIEIPLGTRATSVEVLTIETELIEAAARVPTAIEPQPGLGPILRTAADPEFHGPGFQPEQPAAIGAQGFQRGRKIATLQLAPMRWDPSTGRLERITRMRVRVTLEPVASEDRVTRERIVPEWEDAPVASLIGRGEAPLLSSVGARGPSAQPFKATQLPSVLGSPVAYVIITNDVLAAEFQRLADWKTKSGFPAAVRTVSFIRQNYPFGVDDADRIRQFIRDAYARWGTKFVLLGGDTPVIPTRIARTTFFGGEDIATDLYFSCLDGNWNADNDSSFGEGFISTANAGDNCDLMPEVWVGRAPVTTVAETDLFIDKTFQYTRTPVGDYEFRHLYFAEVLFPQDWQPGQTTSLDGAEMVEECLPYTNLIPELTYARLYENYLDPRWDPGALLETRQRVIDSLNVGYNIALHVGHGFRNVMSVGDGSLQNQDMTSLTNGNRLSNLYAANCTSNAIDFPCIGEAMMLAPNGGSVTSVGSTRFDFPTAGRAFQREYFRLVFDDSISAIGEAQARQKLPYIPFSTVDGANRWTEMTLVLLGDPELRIWTGTPKTLGVSHAATMTTRDTSITVTVTKGGSPLPNAKVTIFKANDEYRIATTGPAGTAVVDFRPDTSGTASVTVTAYDCRPFESTLTINSSGLPVVVEGTPTIDDDNASGTVGNSNGIADAGETIDLRIPVRNNGGATASSVTGVLTSADPNVTITTPNSTYGSVLAGATVNGGNYRMTFHRATPDQREIALTLSLFDGGGRRYLESVQILVRAAEPRHFSHVITEQGGGNGNSRPDPGETVQYSAKLVNLGTGIGNAVTAVLRKLDGNSTVTDSTSSFGTIAPGATVQGDPFTFSITSTAALFELRIFNQFGLVDSQRVDVVWPTTPTSVLLLGSQSSIRATWKRNPEADLLGYNVFRSLLEPGPYTQVNLAPTDSTSLYEDINLTPLTRYYYKISAVDISGNESAQTAAFGGSTNPPYHSVFPISVDRISPASVAVARIYNSGKMDIVAGAEKLFVWHPDGTAPVDADGSEATSGDFTTLGSYYAAGASVADLEGTGGMEIIAPTFSSNHVYVFDSQGQVKPGWPFLATDGMWSMAAIGDLNNDGSKEIVVGTNGAKLLALRANGTEWIDGDANPGTNGVFKALGGGSNFGSPALADIDGDGVIDIVYGSFDGVLGVWNANGANLPGFPQTLGGTLSSSVAIGFLDGAGDTQPEIIVATGAGDDSLYVFQASGARRPGFPKYVKSSGSSKAPSPALADMNNDGFTDIVVASTDRFLYVYDRNGALVLGWPSIPFSANPAEVTESSPVVADINGDGINDILIGDENGVLSAFSGTGQLLAGFPIQLGGEVRGTPALCDCDGDGLTEIVVTGWDAKQHMWDYDFPFSPGQTPPWPQFRHDAMRTGYSKGPTLVDVPLGPPVIGTIEFSPPSPNPTRGHRTRVNWAVPADRAGERFDLAVFDLSGRRVRDLASGVVVPGRFSAEWDLRSADGRSPTGIYFVRLAIGGWQQSRKLVVMP